MKYKVTVSLPSYTDVIEADSQQEAEDIANQMLQAGKLNEGLELYGRLDSIDEIIPPAPPKPQRKHPELPDMVVPFGPGCVEPVGADADEHAEVGLCVTTDGGYEGATGAALTLHLFEGDAGVGHVGIELTTEDCLNLARVLIQATIRGH